MISKIKLEYEELTIRDYIFTLYIILFIAAIYANKIEEAYILEEGKQNPKVSHYIRIAIFSILIIIYIYFLIVAYQKYKKDPDNKDNMVRLVAAVLILIAGLLILYLETQSVLDEEVAL